MFRVYVEQVLCPSLKAGDIVIMDNHSSHNSESTLELIRQCGATLEFLPHSPDFNPIKKMWSKVKNHLRSAEARTPEELDNAIDAALDKMTAKDTTHWFASCGYNFIKNALVLENLADLRPVRAAISDGKVVPTNADKRLLQHGSGQDIEDVAKVVGTYFRRDRHFFNASLAGSHADELLILEPLVGLEFTALAGSRTTIRLFRSPLVQA